MRRCINRVLKFWYLFYSIKTAIGSLIPKYGRIRIDLIVIFVPRTRREKKNIDSILSFYKTFQFVCVCVFMYFCVVVAVLQTRSIEKPVLFCYFVAKGIFISLRFNGRVQTKVLATFPLRIRASHNANEKNKIWKCRKKTSIFLEPGVVW